MIDQNAVLQVLNYIFTQQKKYLIVLKISMSSSDLDDEAHLFNHIKNILTDYVCIHITVDHIQYTSDLVCEVCTCVSRFNSLDVVIKSY